MGNTLYNISKIAPPTVNLLISAKKCSKIISQTRKFIFYLVCSQSKGKIVTTSMTPTKGSSTQQQQRDMVMIGHRNNFFSPTGVPHKLQVGNKVWLHL